MSQKRGRSWPRSSDAGGGMAVRRKGLALALAAAFGLGGAAANVAKTLRRLLKVKDVMVRKLKREEAP
jgi:hypothetical protein